MVELFPASHPNPYLVCQSDCSRGRGRMKGKKAHPSSSPCSCDCHWDEKDEYWFPGAEFGCECCYV